ncbi:hypothetical protein H5410_055529 [Solanum commersonii]|uniref:Uncharacterized protein n=1 Tax=Solanum commersonii TaxID=4109 RepID=A0A9J5WHT8_SOLCO|nr:hypothetical protein H5410_055529 [Solanum commersonii]
MTTNQTPKVGKPYTKWSKFKMNISFTLLLNKLKTRKVDVEDDVWEQYLAAHPKDSKYRTKTLPDYNTLALIFGDIVADGRSGCEINDVEDFQSEFTDDDIAAEKVTIPTEDTQFVDQDDGYFV